MIDAGYVRLMARYNTWQNSQLMPVLAALTPEALVEDRGGFFGGLLATANHILWGDKIWMSRFDPSNEPPQGGISDSPALHGTFEAWSAERVLTDEKIRHWADGLNAADLQGVLIWHSRVKQKDVQTPIGQSVVHFFNHQTHHRGQIHAMLTAIHAQAPVSDLAFMPEDF